MVCGSRSKASAVPDAVQPWASSQIACHLQSLSRGPLPGRGRQNKSPVKIPGIHLPLFEKPVYLPHSYHHPLPDPISG